MPNIIQNTDWTITFSASEIRLVLRALRNVSRETSEIEQAIVLANELTLARTKVAESIYLSMKKNSDNINKD